MSQQGFPNGGILPDDDADFTYSNIITTEADIRAAAQEIVNEAYISGTIESKVADTVVTSIEGLATAGAALAQYYVQQVTYQGNDGFGTENNPVEINYSSAVNELFAKSLGSDANPESIYQSYLANSTNIDGIQNTFFHLGAGPNSFNWDANGNLTVTDTYLFTGLDDLGAAPTVDQASSPGGLLAQVAKFFIGLGVGQFLIPLAELKGDINNLAKMLFGAAAANYVDEGVPFNLFRWAEVNGENVTNIGLIEPMRFRKRFTPQELYENNPTLFFDAVAKGLIPFSVLVTLDNFICNSIEVGAGPDAFGITPNYAPVNTVMSTDPDDWTFGGGGNYPRPFTSFAQRITEANLSLGPFAMIDFKNPTTNVSARFSGRICNLAVVCNGAPGEVGFIRQNWYGADLSGTGYGSNLLKWQWWEQAIKTRYTFPYGHLPGYPDVTIEVATASYAVGDANNFAPDLPIQEDYTLLLGTVLAAAALGAIL
jgi:hypothetical protein